jgi:hypothetical protein
MESSLAQIWPVVWVLTLLLVLPSPASEGPRRIVLPEVPQTDGQIGPTILPLVQPPVWVAAPHGEGLLDLSATFERGGTPRNRNRATGARGAGPDSCGVPYLECARDES